VRAVALDAQLAEVGRALLVALAEKAGEELGSQLVGVLAKRLGPSFIRRELDAWEAMRAGADAAEIARFGPEK
jgi:hypothetical protein